MGSSARLIAIEGIDGAGTTTQARLLTRWMEASGLPAHMTCEPSEGPAGRLLREILQRSTRAMDPCALALLFACDRVDHIRSEIEPMLDKGIHVVSDRYVYSSLAYQSVDLDLQWVAQINKFAPEPDLTVYLRVDPDVAQSRRQSRGSSEELFDSLAYQRRIATNYDNIFGSTTESGSWQLDPTGSSWIQSDPSGSGSSLPDIKRAPHFAILDGALPVDDLHEQLKNLVQKICPPG